MNGKDSWVDYLYIIDTGLTFKIGRGDVPARSNAGKTYSSVYELVAFVEDPNARDNEKRIFEWFKTSSAGREHLHKTPDVVAWVERFRRAYNTATVLGGATYPNDSVYPWSRLPILERRTDWATPKAHIQGQGELFDVKQELGGVEHAGEQVVNYYTERHYAEAVHDVLGGIDLDPMSCRAANLNVRARNIINVEVDGLQDRYPWTGRVYLHPPWESGAKDHAIAKLLHHYETEETTTAIMCLSARSMDAEWFQKKFQLQRFPACIPCPRPRFLKPGGGLGNPTNGAMFLYLGPEVELFTKVFGQFGAVYITPQNSWAG